MDGYFCSIPASFLSCFPVAKTVFRRKTIPPKRIVSGIASISIHGYFMEFEPVDSGYVYSHCIALTCSDISWQCWKKSKGIALFFVFTFSIHAYFACYALQPPIDYLLSFKTMVGSKRNFKNAATKNWTTLFTYPVSNPHYELRYFKIKRCVYDGSYGGTGNYQTIPG